MSEREVVITGLGMTAPLGKNVEENWANAKQLKTGINHYPLEGLPEFLQHVGRVSEHTVPDDIPPKQMGQMKFLNRSANLGFSAACEAIAPSRESIHTTEPGRRALYVASGDHTKVACQDMYPALLDGTNKKWETIDHARLNEAALNKVNPFFLLDSLNNNLFSFLSAYIEFMGPSTSLASLSPYGANALELAYRSIKQNRADVALAVGYGNWITEIAIYELEGLGILSKCKGGSGSYRPFDRNRDGFIPGEGGAAIMFESSHTAEQRGANIIARVKEFSNCVEFSSNEKFGVPDRVCKRSIQSVLKDSSCSVSDLSFIIPHGSGTQKGDRSEMNSLMDIFSEADSDVPVCGLKPYTGHMGAASDLTEIIFGVMALKDNIVPATLNFTQTEKRFEALKISSAPQKCTNNKFLSVSYGVGGQSSSVVIEAD